MSEIPKFSEEGAQPPPQTPPPVGRGTPPPHTPHPSAPSAPRSSRLRLDPLGASILAPPALGVPVPFHLRLEH